MIVAEKVANRDIKVSLSNGDENREKDTSE